VGAAASTSAPEIFLASVQLPAAPFPCICHERPGSTAGDERGCAMMCRHSTSSHIIRQSGIWRFLIARICGRTVLELERERNHATAAVIQLLPAGAELLECEPEGRLRVVRIPSQGYSPTAIRDESLRIDGKA
jgi:hypothetical protein